MKTRVYDVMAEQLEADGLWRRAAERWLQIMLRHGLTDGQREWVCNRRRYCRGQLSGLYVPEKLDVAAVSRAATAAEKRMGPGEAQQSLTVAESVLPREPGRHKSFNR